MGTSLAEPDWPPLTPAEISSVLAAYGLGGGTPAVHWHSPRPMSAVAGVSGALESGELFVKRHHTRVRSTAQLEAEHAFAAWLRERGVPVPEVLLTVAGCTVCERGAWRYEVSAAAPGADVYRDAVSWSPYRSAGHARAAGAALARLHLAAAGFPRPVRPPGVLIGSSAVTGAPDPVAALFRLTGASPVLSSYLAERPFHQDAHRYLVPLLMAASPALRSVPSQWAHGDWHPSNLTWSSGAADAEVAGVFDLSLANRTSAVHDLAVALERSVVAWLDLDLGLDHGAGGPAIGVDLAAARALLDGYQSVRPLTAAERAALPLVLPVVHVEYALSEIEYFAGVTRSPGNAALAYDYLIGHAAWFTTSAAEPLLALPG